MRWLGCAILIFLIKAHSSFGQDTDSIKSSVAIGKSIEVSRFDVSHAFSGMMNVNDVITIMPSLGIGIQKTYALHRFHPRFSLGVGFDVFKNKTNLNFGPKIHSAISTYKLSKNERLSYSDGNVGYFLSYGKQWIFVHQASVGRGVEHQLDSDFSFFYWSFNITFGLAYAL